MWGIYIVMCNIARPPEFLSSACINFSESCELYEIFQTSVTRWFTLIKERFIML